MKSYDTLIYRDVRSLFFSCIFLSPAFVVVVVAVVGGGVVGVMVLPFFFFFFFNPADRI